MSGEKSSLGLGLYVILAILVFSSFLFVGGVTTPGNGSIIEPTPTPYDNGKRFVLDTNQATQGAQTNLQLQKLLLKEITRPPSPPPQSSSSATQNCNEKIVIDLLIDLSNSMRARGKLGEMQKAILSFLSTFPDDTIVGIQSFSSPGQPTHLQEIIPFTPYKNIQSSITDTVDSLQPGGQTYTRDAFVFVKQKLAEAKKKYPDHSFFLIFASDGFPVSASCPGCPETFSKDQDPTQDPDIVKQIKDDGVQVYAIEISDPQQDALFGDQIHKLMDDIAAPNNPIFNNDPTKLTQAYTDLKQKICQ